MTYLVDKYAKNDSLYPKDLEKHSRVLHRLFFDATVLYQRFADAYVSIILIIKGNHRLLLGSLSKY